MTSLNLTPNLERPDDFYASLLAVHEGLSDAETQALNARLILILANHIGSQNILTEALAAAKRASGGA